MRLIKKSLSLFLKSAEEFVDFIEAGRIIIPQDYYLMNLWRK